MTKIRTRTMCSLMCLIVVGCGTTNDDPRDGGSTVADSGGGGVDGGNTSDTGMAADAGPGGCAPAAGETEMVSAGSLFLSNNRFSPDSGSLAAVAFEGFSSRGVRIVDLCGTLVTDIGNDDGPRATLAWSNDAATVYYGTSDGAKSVLAAGGTPEDVAADADTFDVSPDGTTLVYSDNGDLFTWDIATSTPTDLMVAGSFPRYSPDGTQVAFVEGGMLQILTLAGSAVDMVGAIDNAAFQPFDWLSDDSFAVAAAAGVETVVPDGTGVYTRTTVEEGSAVQDIDVSPDGTMISYRINAMRPVYLYGVE